jgi:hypothetical protein
LKKLATLLDAEIGDSMWIGCALKAGSGGLKGSPKGVKRVNLYVSSFTHALISILLKKSHSKNQEKIFRSQKLRNARSELG